MKRNLVIVGAGLGGCFLADSLAENWSITFVELGSRPTQLQQRMRDTDKTAITYPHVGSGLGGTTSVWHNGLMEVEEGVFQKKWPFPKSELTQYYREAFQKLAGVSQADITKEVGVLRHKLRDIGLSESLLGLGLYYPRRRVNAWHALALKNRVKIIKGEVVRLVSGNNCEIRTVLVKSGNQEFELGGDVFVLAAGGLGTPLLLQKLAETLTLPALQQAGLNYEDHPSGFVADVVLDAPLYKLWNYPVASAKGNLRLPLVVKQDGLLISFQLRPAAQFRMGPSRNRVKSMLNQLRNEPLNLRNYIRLLSHSDDVMEILSFKFGIRLPTRHYSLLMVAEQPPSSGCAVWRDEHSEIIYRKWSLAPNYINSLQEAIQQVLRLLGNKVKSANVFPGWIDDAFSSSHHSGTARMAASPSRGVCDQNGLVHGITNLYVCDGSLIPASGYANTGLTIAALALRLANHLRTKF